MNHENCTIEAEWARLRSDVAARPILTAANHLINIGVMDCIERAVVAQEAFLSGKAGEIVGVDPNFSIGSHTRHHLYKTMFQGIIDGVGRVGPDGFIQTAPTLSLLLDLQMAMLHTREIDCHE